MTAYNETQAYEVTGLISQGFTLLEIERMPGMPTAAEFASWVVNTPPLALAFEKARQTSSFTMEDEALALTRAAKDNSELTTTQLKALDLHIGQLRWSATKRNPQVYSDKAAVSMVVPVQINTTLDMGHDPTKIGTAEHPNIYDLTAVNIVEVEQGAEATEQTRPKLAPPKRTPQRRKRVLPPRIALTPEERAEAERQSQLRAIKFAEQKAKRRGQQKIRHSRGRYTKDGTSSPACDDVQAEPGPGQLHHQPPQG